MLAGSPRKVPRWKRGQIGVGDGGIDIPFLLVFPHGRGGVAILRLWLGLLFAYTCGSGPH